MHDLIVSPFLDKPATSEALCLSGTIVEPVRRSRNCSCNAACIAGIAGLMVVATVAGGVLPYQAARLVLGQLGPLGE